MYYPAAPHRIQQALLFGQVMFLTSLGVSALYRAWLSSLDREKVHRKFLFERVLENPTDQVHVSHARDHSGVRAPCPAVARSDGTSSHRTRGPSTSTAGTLPPPPTPSLTRPGAMPSGQHLAFPLPEVNFGNLRSMPGGGDDARKRRRARGG